MGTNDLHSKFIDRPNHEKKGNKPQNLLKELDGTVGVDVSPILYRCTCSPLGSAVCEVNNPMVPLYHAYREATNYISSLTDKHNLNILIAFDNKLHPMKAHTQADRRAKRQHHLDELRRLYEMDDINDAIIESVTNHRKNLACPREDLIAMVIKFCDKKKIKYCCGPFEADWQLVALQKQGFIKHIMSVDGDVFVLGGDSIVTEVNMR